MFGQGVQFKMAGEEVYQTWIGSLLSLLLLAVVACYAGFKFIVMVTYEDVTISTKVEANRLDKDFSFGPQDGFNVAFGLVDLRSTTLLDDPEYF